ncbi:hypothetical protein [Niallia oryzisoli]|uniref:hypothetical protein n=1 Tax=Niallia oryzisoli TaxID=1737571 RepID=UPI0037358807
MDKENRYSFEGQSIQGMNGKSVREVLETSATGYGLESVIESKEEPQKDITDTE